MAVALRNFKTQGRLQPAVPIAPPPDITQPIPAVQPVTSFSDGGSVFDVFNMSGNVVEWIQDVYSTQFYANSPAENPGNLDDGTQHIYRGGSFGNTNGAFSITSRRYAQAATYFDVDVGFRCAADLP